MYILSKSPVITCRLYCGKLNNCSNKDILKPNLVDHSDFVTASNCFGSPIKAMFACILPGEVHNPEM